MGWVWDGVYGWEQGFIIIVMQFRANGMGTSLL